ncbi:hypothetical protein [Halorientalis litorea]|nr:hypothetical protein [Halorientalis litorea]
MAVDDYTGAVRPVDGSDDCFESVTGEVVPAVAGGPATCES